MTAKIERRGNAWRVRVGVVDRVTGKRRQLSHTIPPGPDGKALGKREAQTKADAWALSVRQGNVRSADITLAGLIDAYHQARPKMSPGTKQGDRGYFRRNVPERLANTPINKIDAYTLDQLYLRLLESGGTCGMRKNKCDTVPCPHGAGAPLGAGSVRRLHGLLSAAFGQAVKWGWITQNPCELASPPESAETEVDPPDVEEVLVFLDYVASLDRAESMLPDFVDVLIATGARPAEVCALKVGDIDLETGLTTIRRAFSRGDKGTVKLPKNSKVRYLRLDPDTIKVLTARRSRLAKVALLGGYPVEESWLFPSPSRSERPVWPTSLGKEFREARAACEISDRLTARNLRHFVATILLSEGVDVRTAAGRLGHDPVLTLRRYSHVLDRADVAAAPVVSMALRRAREEREQA